MAFIEQNYEPKLIGDEETKRLDNDTGTNDTQLEIIADEAKNKIDDRKDIQEANENSSDDNHENKQSDAKEETTPELPVAPDDHSPNAPAEAPSTFCRRCRDFWFTACTGICCCFPESGYIAQQKTETTSALVKNPLNERRHRVSCTDLPTLIFFSLVAAASFAVCVVAIVKGNPMRLYYGYDSFGNTCGSGNGSAIFDNRPVKGCSLSGRDMTNKKFVFFMDALYPFSSMRLCVEQCPTGESGSGADIAIAIPCVRKVGITMCGLKDYYDKHKVRLCRYDIDPDVYFKQESGLLGPCPSVPVMGSSPVFNRCVPEIGQTAFKKVWDAVVGSITQSRFYQTLIRSVVGSSVEITLLLLLSTLMAFLIIVLIYFITSVIFWVLLALAGVGMVTGTSLLWYQYTLYKNGTALPRVVPILEIEYASERTFLFYSITATILTVTAVIAFAVAFNKIKVVIKVFHRAGRILVSSPLLLFVPVITVVFLGCFVAFWTTTLLALSSAGDARVNETTGFVYVAPNRAIEGAWWFHAFCFFWFSQFILDCQNVVVAAVIVNYFFRPDDRCIVFPVTRAICTLVRHHIGSVAFGSLFVTLWRIPKYVIRIIKVKLPDLQEPFQINRNGYAMVTIERSCFFNAANNAEAELLRNSLQVKAINSLGDFVLIVGKIFVTSFTLVVGFYWLKSKPDNEFFLFPLFLVVVFAYFVSHSFMSVYEAAVDTLLLCYCVDVADNDGAAAHTREAGRALEEASGEIDRIDEETKAKRERLKRRGKRKKRGDDFEVVEESQITEITEMQVDIRGQTAQEKEETKVVFDQQSESRPFLGNV